MSHAAAMRVDRWAVPRPRTSRNPPSTALLRDAAARGCAVLDGLGMLVNQGVISVRHWMGIDADPAVMRRAIEEIFGL